MLGLVPRMKRRKMRKHMAELPGSVGIANVRYSTSGETNPAALLADTQPCLYECSDISLAISYNGNVVNIKKLRKEILQRLGATVATADSELICKKLYLELLDSKSMSEAVRTFLQEVEGAYSVVGITGNGELFAFRDRLGIKPLCLGFSSDGKICAVSSESVGLDINELNHKVFTPEPGELVTISENGIKREILVKCHNRALCGFEFAYFARPDSILNGSKYVYEVRTNFGRNLAKAARKSGVADSIDCVVPVPETSDDSAYGFHVELNLPLERAIRRHRFITDRAFITLPQERHTILDKKMNVLGDKLRDKRVALIDDSIVRGDTTRSVIQKLRSKGVREIHAFITFPKIVSPCFYGIDMATFSELIGFLRSTEEVAKLIGADSVTYQSVEDFVSATGLSMNELCLACITGKYPTPLAQRLADEAKEHL
ncbi:MAG: amidophosphoribosyltransferase, partial [Candidatus Bathyarchaeia archaeon]